MEISNKITSEEIIDSTAQLLNLQIALGSIGAPFGQEHFNYQITDHYTLGYIMGFSLGTLHSCHVEDPKEKNQAVKSIYQKVFGEDGLKLMASACSMNDTYSQFKEGKTKGTAESMDSVQHKIIPMSLAKYLMRK